MKVVITAGGTSEPIDAVRSIKNDATGELASRIAQEIAKQFPKSEIFYVHAQRAIIPQNDNVTPRGIKTVSDLEGVMQSILTKETIDFVIHTMAVSDYKTKVAIGNDTLETIFVNWNKHHTEKMQYNDFISALNEMKYDADSKLSSVNENLFVTLTKTPKIIEKIKVWSPRTKLIGFKLLSDVPHEQLIDVAYKQLLKNDELYVVANDKSDITTEKHVAYIIDQDCNETKCRTKLEIAQVLTAKLREAEGMK